MLEKDLMVVVMKIKFNNSKWNFLVLIFAWLILIVLFTGCKMGGQQNNEESQSGYTVVDDFGTKVYFKAPPQKIITLAMGTDSIVLGLGEQKRLLAISSLADDPSSSNVVKQAQQIKRKIWNPSQEEVLSLNPELVLTYAWTDPELIKNIRSLGINVFVIKNPQTISDIKDNVHQIAAALHIFSSGDKLTQMMDDKLLEIKKKLAQKNIRQPKKVVLVSLMNTYGGKGCIFDDMCREAGVINGVAAAGIENGQPVTKEMLVKINPDLFIMPVYNDHNTFDINKYNKEFLEDPALQTLTAIKNKQLFYPKEGFIYNCSQDVVFGVQEIAHAAYGETFSLSGDSHLHVEK
ncbi:ABC transporter substrate-binding protein [uncultured Phascolarctobacterium sp.]|uniref:ABC transporter substrate-binding protein n=1 Tax=uncultured Phascolarctobacterium sp. TaxID=512296 RepID=UPI0025D2401F|nr:ABC transporter substrate-binding protein [uncultured Phascolarctobacterium sp.]